MPRNGSGTCAVTNTFAGGSTISSANMNANFADFAAEITNSLPRDGQAAMTAALKAYAGTLSAPGISWGVDTSTGIRRSAGGAMRHVSSGVDIMEVSSTGMTMVAGTITDQNSVVVVGTPTGAGMLWFATTAPTGWVRCNGRTIGNASSAATERANIDTAALFAFLWNNFDNTRCPVSGGRGVDATTDYAANKTIGLPDMRGRSPFGLDDMGNSAASRLGTIITSSTTNGAAGGSETHTLTQSQLPNVSLTGSAAVSGNYTLWQPATTGRGVSASGAINDGWGGGGTTTGSGSWSGTASVSLGGSGAAQSSMPPAFLTTFIIKL